MLVFVPFAPFSVAFVPGAGANCISCSLEALHHRGRAFYLSRVVVFFLAVSLLSFPLVLFTPFGRDVISAMTIPESYESREDGGRGSMQRQTLT